MANKNLTDEIFDLKSKYQESVLLINSLVQEVSCQNLKIQQLEASTGKKQDEKVILYPVVNEKVFKKKLFELIKDEFEDWCSNSTSHGIPNVVKSKNMVLKISWLILFVLSSALCLYSVIPSVIKYLQFNENTGVQQMIDLPTEFPSVTICNLNPYSVLFDEFVESELEDSLYLNDYDSYVNQIMYYLYQEDSKFNLTLNNTKVNTRLNYIMTIRRNIIFFSFMTYIEKNLSRYEDLLLDKFLESIISCEFDGISCLNKSNFSILKSIQYSICFTFNGNKNHIKKIGRSGQNNGLNLKLYLNDTYESFTFLRGLRLFIHNATDESPTLERNVIAVSPGFQTNIAIKKTVTQKLAKPYTDCLDDLTPNSDYKTDIMRYMFDSLNLTHYSYKICESVVYQINLNQTCNCLDPNVQFSDWKQFCQIDDDENFDDNTCDGIEDINCMVRFNLNFSTNPNDFIANYCPFGIYYSLIFFLLNSKYVSCINIECFKVDYNTEISQSQFLTDWYLDFMKKSLFDYVDILNDSSLNPQIAKLARIFPQNITASEIRNNLISFNVYYSGLSYTLMADTPQDDWFTFIANVGGLMGAFIGISIMSFAEVVELIFRVIYILVTNILKFKKSRNQVMTF